MLLQRPAALAAALLAVSAAAAPAAAGDIDYLAATCAACHGGAGGAIPALAGKPSADLAAALRAFRDGTRPDLVMAAVATGLDDATVAALADHFAARP